MPVFEILAALSVGTAAIAALLVFTRHFRLVPRIYTASVLLTLATVGVGAFTQAGVC